MVHAQHHQHLVLGALVFHAHVCSYAEFLQRCLTKAHWTSRMYVCTVIREAAEYGQRMAGAAARVGGRVARAHGVRRPADVDR